MIFDDQKLWIFGDELMDMSLSMIQDGVDTCELVIAGKYEQMEWGLEVAEFIVRKDVSRLEYTGDFAAEILTSDLLAMLEEIRDARVWFEDKFGRN